METGPKISIAAHGALILLAIFGGPLFDSDDSKAIQISEVSIITSAEFDSMMSSAPNGVEMAEPAPQVTPSAEASAVEPPQQDAPVETPAAPETQPQTVEAAPEVQTDTPQPRQPPAVEAPEVADQQQEATGSAVVIPDAQTSNEDTRGQREPDQLALLRPKPRPAPRIDSTPAPKPETDADRSADVQQSTTPTEAPTEPEQVEREETAPPEATTEIVTEPEQDPNSAAPLRSARPKGRPADLVQKAIAAKEAEEKRKADEAQAEADRKAADAKAEADRKAADAADKAAAEQARKDAEAKAIEAALKAATAESNAPKGPPLSGSEKGALVLAVQKCWNVPVGVQNAGNLVVTVKVDLSPDGRITGSPVMIEPAGQPTGLIQQAFEAGRRALLMCQPYNLPREKYEQWKTIEVVFNPQNMVLR